ncbi:uncharacterized protein [Nicotiana tomentosiformis]|uniref:uncharacterized protein n=1 Tax=Nicotiana tomentosiformis TaxID=4098 RepID=UPI00388C35EE
MESDSICYMQKCHQCQIYGDFILVPPNELNVMGSPCTFATCVKDVIGTIEPTASNRYCFILELYKNFTKIEFKHVPGVQNEFADALATLSSMIQHPDKNYIDPIEIEVRDQHAYYFHIDEEPDGKLWYHDIKRFLEVEASTYKVVTKKVVVDFVCNNIVCRFGISDSIITDNADNLHIDLMKEICKKFRIVHRNSTSYRPQMNGAIEAANKNIKRILRKIVDNHKQWHEKMSFALLVTLPL